MAGCPTFAAAVTAKVGSSAFHIGVWSCLRRALRAPLYPASSQKVLKSSAKADHFLPQIFRMKSLPSGRFLRLREICA